MLISSSLQALVASFVTLRIHFPPKVRLIDTGPSRRSIAPDSRASTPVLSESSADLLTPLSLSGNPVLLPASEAPPSHPIFGFPSLSKPSQEMTDATHMGSSADPDAMDVDPPSPMKQRSAFRIDQRSNVDDPVWLRPQRFFAPETPTGLESLLERTLLADEATGEQGHTDQRNAVTSYACLKRLGLWLALTVALASVGIAVRTWQVRDDRTRDTASDTPVPVMETAFGNVDFSVGSVYELPIITTIPNVDT
jgi:hypothetical protein